MPDLLVPWKALFAGVAFVLTFALFVPYIRSIRAGDTIPHVFSWVIWAVGTFVVFLAQLADGAGVGAWPIGFSACITAYIATLAYRRRSQTPIARLDWLALATALAAIGAWALTAEALWAVLLLTGADLVGFVPTLRRAWSQPYQEHLGFFFFGAVRNTFVVLALEHYSWTTVLFPAAVGVACLAVALFLLARRAAIGAQAAP